MGTIPADLFVSVTPGVLAAGGSALDLNGLILSTSTRVPIGTVGTFSSVEAVEAYFGGGSKEAQIAGGGPGLGSGYFGGFDTSTVKPEAILFAQYPLANVGAYLRGGDISDLTLTQLQAITGTLSVMIDGVAKSGSVDLSGATSFTNAGQIIADTLAITGPQSASVSATIAGIVMTVASVTSGAIKVGDKVTGTSVTDGSYVASFGTGVGGAGTYNLTESSTVASPETVTTSSPGVSFDSVSGAFVVVSSTTGASSTIAFATGTEAPDLFLTSATGAVLSQGAIASVPGTFMDALIRVNTNWATFMTGFDPDNGSGHTQKLAFSAWTNSKLNRFCYVAWDTDAAPTASNPATNSFEYAVQQAGYSGTCPVWEPDDTNLAAFVCGSVASINFQAPNGRIAFAFKSQAGLVPGVTDEVAAVNLGGNPQVAGDRGNGYNYYGAIATANQSFVNFQRGFVSGPFSWLDTYVNQIWLNSQLQLALMLYLAQVNSVPFNAAGDAAIEAVLADPIQQAISFGAIAPGVTLTSSQITAVNAAAGKDIATTLSNQGWYVLIIPASGAVRQSRGPRQVMFFYVDGESVQSFSLSSVVLQ